MKYQLYIFAAIFICISILSCNVSPSSPGGKLGTKNYYGNYTLGASSGTAYTYLNATGDTLIELRYSLNSAPTVTLSNVTFKENGADYSVYKSDGIGTLTGTCTSNFGMLSWQYVSSGSTIGFTGNKIQ